MYAYLFWQERCQDAKHQTCLDRIFIGSKSLGIALHYVYHSVGVLGFPHMQYTYMFTLWHTRHAYKPSPKEKFCLFRSTTCPASLFKIQYAKNRKCIEWPETDLEHLILKSPLYSLNTCCRGPNFTPFHSKMAPFQVNCRFWFPYMLQRLTWNFQGKSLKIKNSKQRIFAKFSILKKATAATGLIQFQPNFVTSMLVLGHYIGYCLFWRCQKLN